MLPETTLGAIILVEKLLTDIEKKSESKKTTHIAYIHGRDSRGVILIGIYR